MYGFMIVDKHNNYKHDQIYESSDYNFVFCTHPNEVNEFLVSIDNDNIMYMIVEILGNITYTNSTFLTNKVKLIKILTKNSFILFLKNIKQMPNYEFISPNNNIYRFADGKLHSENDLPAIQETDKFGIKHNYWYDYGILHRKNGPAIELSDGTKIYYYYGMKHRSNGPALITKFGDNIWYNSGFVHRKNGPAIQWKNGTNEWYFNGQRHNSNGPAVILVNGTRKWYNMDKLHRLDGPAIIYSDGYKEWYVDGSFSHSEEYNYDIDNDMNSESTDCTTNYKYSTNKYSTNYNSAISDNKTFSLFRLFE